MDAVTKLDELIELHQRLGPAAAALRLCSAFVWRQVPVFEQESQAAHRYWSGLCIDLQCGKDCLAELRRARDHLLEQAWAGQ